jgi:hypothetical protein
MNIKQKLVSAKNKISDNKTKILGTIAVVSTTAVVLHQLGKKQMDAFLTEKGLYDEYYTPDAD